MSSAITRNLVPTVHIKSSNVNHTVISKLNSSLGVINNEIERSFESS